MRNKKQKLHKWQQQKIRIEYNKRVSVKFQYIQWKETDKIGTLWKVFKEAVGSNAEEICEVTKSYKIYIGYKLIQRTKNQGNSEISWEKIVVELRS